jgi:hypothetical protein
MDKMFLLAVRRVQVTESKAYSDFLMLEFVENNATSILANLHI